MFKQIFDFFHCIFKGFCITIFHGNFHWPTLVIEIIGNPYRTPFLTLNW